MNSDVRDFVQSKIKSSAINVGDLGKKQILKRLTETNDPWQSLVSIQKDFAMTSTSVTPPLTMLNYLGFDWCQSHVSLCNRLESDLLKECESFNEDKTLLMLQFTVHFFTIPTLRSIPVNLIKRLARIPEKYIHFLANNVKLDDIPLNVKRQIWQHHENLFVSAIEPFSKTVVSFSNLSLDRKLIESDIRNICDAIGDSEKLFSMFSQFCLNKSVNEPEKNYPYLFREVLMAVQNSEYKLQGLGKLNELAWLLDGCARQKKVDVNSISSIFTILESMITSYAKKLDINLDSSKSTNENKFRNTKTHSILTPKEDSLSIKTNVVVAPKDLNSALQLSLKFLLKEDKRKLFTYKVTDAIAPGYSSIIRSPMDFNSIKRKINKSEYKGFSEFEKDVELIFMNCRAFNGEESVIGKYGDTIESKWSRKKEHFRNLCANASSQDQFSLQLPITKNTNELDELDSNNKNRLKLTLKTDKNCSFSSPPNQTNILRPLPLVIKYPLSHEYVENYLAISKSTPDIALLEIAVKYLRVLDSQNIFLNPVTDEIAPEYSKFVKNPICISDIENRFAEKFYLSINDLNNDVKLMIDNCYAYNGTKGYIPKIADKFAKQWFKEALTILNEAQTSKESFHSSSSLVLRVSNPKQSTTANLVTKPRNIKTYETFFAKTQSEWVDNSGIVTNTRVSEALKSCVLSLYGLLDCVWNIMVDLDYTGMFSTPTIHSITESNDTLDLGVIRCKLDRNEYLSVKEFELDVKLMISQKVLKGNQNHSIVNAFQSSFSILMENAKVFAKESAPEHLPDFESGSTTKSALACQSIDITSRIPSNDKIFENHKRKISAPCESNKRRLIIEGTKLKVGNPNLYGGLKSIKNAIHVFKNRSEVADIPEVAMCGDLLWATLLLRDSLIQSYFTERLCTLLIESIRRKIDISKPQLQSILPHENRFVRMLCQLIQLSLSDESTIFRSLNEILPRHALPLFLMFAWKLNDVSDSTLESLNLKVCEKLDFYVEDPKINRKAKEIVALSSSLLKTYH